MAETIAAGIVIIDDNLMVAVPKEFFFEGMPLPVPVYLRMKNDNYLIIGKKTEKVNFTSLHSYKAPDVRVYVRKEDQPTLIQFASGLTKRMMNEKGVPNSLKGKFLGGLMQNALACIDEKGLGSVVHLQKVSGFLLEVSETVDIFQDVLTLLEGLPNEDAKHAMSTCMISLMIADEMDLSLKAGLEKLALGSLLHDIGLKTVPEAILQKPRHLWTLEEVTMYESHPMKGVEMLRDFKDISNDVLLIVAEHHENAHGTGFPKKIRDVKISPLSRIVILADYFSTLMFARHSASRSYTADEAITYIEDIMGQPFNKQVFLALKNIINKRYLADRA